MPLLSDAYIIVSRQVCCWEANPVAGIRSMRSEILGAGSQEWAECDAQRHLGVPVLRPRVCILPALARPVCHEKKRPGKGRFYLQ